MRAAFIISAFLLLSGCAMLPAEKKPAEPFYLKPAAFKDLPGWADDDAAAALEPFKKSCARILEKNPDENFGFAGTAASWQDACNNIPEDADEARRYFEENFTPYAVSGRDGFDGLFTGYYEPLLHGSYTRHKPYLIPLYARPADLVTADLSDFKPDLKNLSITGRVKKTKDGARLVPYYTRAQIEKGALKKQKKIVWVDSAVDAFFLHIQGSGLVKMQNGETLHLGYAAQNGLPYVAIGRELLKRGDLGKSDVSMQSIRAWLDSHPDEAPEVMNVNASYVFFRKLGDEGPAGAEGVALTPGRSLAVDHKKIPYGAPLWIDTQDPDGEKLNRLMIAQDTGGAIAGAVRGDFFWGAGEDAADKAGRMKSMGRAFILLPRAVAVPDDKKWQWWRSLFFKKDAKTPGAPVAPQH